MARVKRSSARPRVALYARISTLDQQTLPLQIRTMKEYAARPLGTFASRSCHHPEGTGRVGHRYRLTHRSLRHIKRPIFVPNRYRILMNAGIAPRRLLQGWEKAMLDLRSVYATTLLWWALGNDGIGGKFAGCHPSFDNGHRDSSLDQKMNAYRSAMISCSP